jgi:hypothetical protein
MTTDSPRRAVLIAAQIPAAPPPITAVEYVSTTESISRHLVEFTLCRLMLVTIIALPDSTIEIKNDDREQKGDSCYSETGKSR